MNDDVFFATLGLAHNGAGRTRLRPISTPTHRADGLGKSFCAIPEPYVICADNRCRATVRHRRISHCTRHVFFA